MTTEGADTAVQWSADGGREWPLAVPRELLTVYQPIIGGPAVLAWVNLYEIASRPDFRGDAVAETARRMGVDAAGLEEILNVLERAGLLERRGARITLRCPEAGASAPVSAVHAAARESAAAGQAPAAQSAPAPVAPARVAPSAAPEVGIASPAKPDPAAVAAAPSPEVGSGSSGDDSGLEAVVAFYHQRIGLLGPSQFEKLRFWLEEMGMSSDVIALAIEETVQNAKTPRMNYLEAVLRNWYNDGIRTVADLQRSRQARASALPQRSEGAPNASAYETIDPDAVRRWKEMYADEYDG